MSVSSFKIIFLCLNIFEKMCILIVKLQTSRIVDKRVYSLQSEMDATLFA